MLLFKKLPAALLLLLHLLLSLGLLIYLLLLLFNGLLLDCLVAVEPLADCCHLTRVVEAALDSMPVLKLIFVIKENGSAADDLAVLLEVLFFNLLL